MLESSNWKITQGYGLTEFAKTHPGYYKSFGGIHPGIDFVGDTEIMPFVSGTVTQAGWQEGWGFTVTIYDGRFYHLYAHLAGFFVKRGMPVTAWETKIGNMGSTGISTGVHLHYGKYYKVFWKKIYIDPTDDLIFNEKDMLIKNHVNHNKKNIEDLLNGIKALGFDKGREKPYLIQNGVKQYYRTTEELFASQFCLWVKSSDADKIPNKT